MGGRPEGSQKFELDGGPWDEEGLIEVHLEGDGSAGDQSHLDILPVLIGGVLDNGPALQIGLLLLVQDQTIAGLPDGVLDHIAHAHLTLTLTQEADAHRLLLRVMRQSQRLQSLFELALLDRIEETHTLHFGQLQRPQTVSAPQVEEFDLDGAVLARCLLLSFNADDRSCHGPCLVGIALSEDDFDLLAAGLVEDLTEARIVRQVDGEGLEGAFDGSVGVVGDGGDVAAVQVTHHHALEQVVDVCHRERQIDPGVALHLPFPLEVAHSAAEQHHLTNRQLGGLAAGLVVLALLLPGLGCAGPEPEQGRTDHKAADSRKQIDSTHRAFPFVFEE